MYLIQMETKRNKEEIKGWYAGTALNIATLAKDAHRFTSKDFCEEISNILKGRKTFLNEVFYIKTKVVEVKKNGTK